MHPLHPALLACLLGSCATTQAGNPERRPWCNDRSGVPSVAPDWTLLEGLRPVPVHPDESARSRRRLANRSVLPISEEEARRLTRSALGASPGRPYLIRGGLLMEPGATAADVITRMRDPNRFLLEVQWSASLRSLGVVTVSAMEMRLVPGAPHDYDVPLVIRAQVRPRQASVSCVGTIH